MKKKNEIFIQRLKMLRNEKNMTQLELAKKMGVSRSKVASWETGERIPSAEETEFLLRFFAVPAEYFYGLGNNRYNINTEGIFELDLTKLNSEGIMFLKQFYLLLINSEEYSSNQGAKN